MKKYDTYKDSGIEWIGEIPSHWEVNRFKYLFFEHSGNGFPNELQGRSKGEIPFFKVSDLNKEGITVEYSNNYVSFNDVSDNGWNIVPEKSILTAKIGESLKKNHRKISSVQCIIDNNCLGIEPISINGKYAFYQLRIIDFDWFVNPGAIPSISMEKLRNHFFPISPSPEEQTAIASYLDRKTSEIDELIADKKRLLELYEEEKTAIINQAVTGKWKMENGKWKMKDSGIEWLGEIPEHWSFVSLKWIARIYSGGTPSRNNSEYWVDGTIPWLNSGTVNQGDITEPSEFITEEALINSSAKWIPEKALVIALAGQGKTKGMVAQVQFKTTCNQSLGVIVPNEKINNRFLMYWLRDNYQNIRNLGGGDKRDGINLEMIGGIPLPLPEYNEQTKIVQYIESKCLELLHKVEKTEKLIDLLTEYRTSLISEVVTGKIKVTE